LVAVEEEIGNKWEYYLVTTSNETSTSIYVVGLQQGLSPYLKNDEAAGAAILAAASHLAKLEF
jgi:hypothetical protein